MFVKFYNFFTPAKVGKKNLSNFSLLFTTTPDLETFKFFTNIFLNFIFLFFFIF